MIWCNVLDWMSDYQIKTIAIGVIIVVLCIGGYILMDKTKENDGIVIMRRNAKGQFQKAAKNEAFVVSNKKNDSFISEIEKAVPTVQPEVEIKKAAPKPEVEIRHASKPSVTDFFTKSTGTGFGTNADMIRSMSDDQLADFLSDIERSGFIKLWLKSKQDNTK